MKWVSALSKQTDINQSLIQSLGLDKVAMFDIELYETKDVKYIEYWVEHYKNGESDWGQAMTYFFLGKLYTLMKKTK